MRQSLQGLLAHGAPMWMSCSRVDHRYLIYQRSWGCFIALYGAVFVLVGLAVGDETGIFLDVVGLAMVVVGLMLLVSYYLRKPPR
jgi:hypothetical protein